MSTLIQPVSFLFLNFITFMVDDDDDDKLNCVIRRETTRFERKKQNEFEIFSNVIKHKFIKSRELFKKQKQNEKKKIF